MRHKDYPGRIIWAFIAILFISTFIPRWVLAGESDLLLAEYPAGTVQDIPAPQSTSESPPLGVSKGTTSSDIFGSRKGFIHPFLAVTEYWTDNVFYSNTNKKSDWATVISPGIWLALPHVKERLLQIETANISPGGFSLSRYQPEIFKRYQLYLFYNADFEQFSKFSSQNADNHRAEGFFQYNLRGGLTLELLDQFIYSHDARGTGTQTTELDKFRDNLVNTALIYDVSNRFKLRAEYSNFFVDYLAPRNDFRNRDDNVISGYVFYKLKPKTSAFIQYEFADIKYRKDPIQNSTEQHWFAGLEWDITAKSKGRVKAGYGIKDFANSSSGGNNPDFIVEVQTDYQFTPKTSVILKASRMKNETNVNGAEYILANSVELQYLQKLTGKITADIKLSYINDEYKGDVTLDGVTKRLTDNYYSAAAALRYKFKEWLQLDVGYIYDKRVSSFSDLSYTANIIFLRITGSL